MLDHSNLTIQAKGKEDNTTREFIHHSSAQRVFTHVLIAESLASQYPDLPITTIPGGGPSIGCSLLEYAALGFADVTPIVESALSPLKTRSYLMPARRMDSDQGVMADELIYAKYMYTYKHSDYILYIVSGRDGDGAPWESQRDLQYLIGPTQDVADELIKGATEYQSALHDEIWVSSFAMMGRKSIDAISAAESFGHADAQPGL